MFDRHVERGPDWWVWMGTTDSKGRYGVLRRGRRVLLAHRVAWEIKNGPIPAGMAVCHTCDNPPCVRPDHLWLGTLAENIRDRDAKGRAATGDRNGARTHPERLPRGDNHFRRCRPDLVLRGSAHGRARLTEDQVLDIRARCAAGETRKAVADSYGVGRTLISQIALRQIWRHI